MKVSKSELVKLGAMLDAYKSEHGTIATSSTPTLNTWGCTASCTSSCYSYCDGSRCFCWKAWKGNG